MDDAVHPRVSTYGVAGSRRSDPVPLCCAMTHLAQALATCVPRTEMRMDLLRGLCECRAFRTEEIGWRSGDGAS
jgi:hypothetical protein